jgi:hypothetical protein
LICIVGGNRFPHHSRQLASSEASRLSLHRHNGNTAIEPSGASVDRPCIRPGNRPFLRTNWLISADWQYAGQDKRRTKRLLTSTDLLAKRV